MARKKPARARRPAAPAAPAEPPRALSVADVDAIVRLISECRRQGVAQFEGPACLKFIFKRDQQRPAIAAGAAKVIGDEWIPE